MGYIDAQGRPELIAKPFIKKGAASGRVVTQEDRKAAAPTTPTAANFPNGDRRP